MESRNYSQEGKVKVLGVGIATVTLRGLREERNLSWRIKVKGEALIQAECVDRGSAVEGLGENSASGSGSFYFLSLNYLTAMDGCDLKTAEFLLVLAKPFHVRNL